MKEAFKKYILETNLKGSNKASSYMKALELLDTILDQPSSLNFHAVDFWSIDSPKEIERLYQYALKSQKKEGSEFLNPKFPQSYGKDGYYSAALKSYAKFLYEKELWQTLENAQEGIEVADKLDNLPVQPAVFMLDEPLFVENIEGREVLREVKSRLNQSFFRKMILRDYRNQCAVTGLNIPEVLRASHIISWSADKKNRLNPCNGLCLSATYDAAFDRHLISFDKKYRMVLSPDLKEYHTNEAFQKYFKVFEGTQLNLPDRFFPDQNLLEKHRQKLT